MIKVLLTSWKCFLLQIAQPDAERPDQGNPFSYAYKT